MTERELSKGHWLVETDSGKLAVVHVTSKCPETRGEPPMNHGGWWYQLFNYSGRMNTRDHSCKVTFLRKLDIPELTLYDYTKVKSRLAQVKSGQWPTNYQLTYSINERSHWRTITSYLEAGFNCSIVFDTEYNPQSHKIGELPTSWTIGGRSWDVVDGDKHDLRLTKLDGRGKLVGLRFKGSRKRMDQAIARGFVFSAN